MDRFITLSPSIKHVTRKVAIFSILLSSILLLGSISPIWAAQLEVRMSPDVQETHAEMKYQKTIFIEYDEGGQIADELRGTQSLVQFTADSSTPGMSELIDKLNQNMASQGSKAKVSDLMVDYRAELTGRGLATSIDFKIIVKPTITNYVIRSASGDSPAIVDIAWRGLTVDGPVVLKTAEYGDVEINQPISFIKSNLPNIYSNIKGTDAEALLSKSLLDASYIKEQPLSNWHFLFDPTGINVDASTYGLSKDISGFVVSHYTMGESSLREGRQVEQVEESQFTADKPYSVRTVQSADSANVSLIGFAAVDKVEGQEVFGVSPNAPQGYATTSSGKFPVSIIYGMAAMAGIGAIAVFFISSRKLKAEAGQGQRGIDPSQLRAYSTSSASGGYQTTRGEAQLISDEQYERTRSVYEQEQDTSSTQSGGSKGGAMPKGWKPSD